MIDWPVETARHERWWFSLRVGSHVASRRSEGRIWRVVAFERYELIALQASPFVSGDKYSIHGYGHNWAEWAGRQPRDVCFGVDNNKDRTWQRAHDILIPPSAIEWVAHFGESGLHNAITAGEIRDAGHTRIEKAA